MFNLGWFSTGRDKAARDLLQAVQSRIEHGEINARIAFVFCNREPGESSQSDLFLNLVEGYHIPLVCFSYHKYQALRGVANPNPEEPLPAWRLDYDREVMTRLDDYEPSLCVLAGYMLITGKEMCHKYDTINLHPAAPGGPVGTWQGVIWQLIDANAGETGVLMNLVTPELDKGPVVAYCTFPIRGQHFNRYWREIEGRSVNEIRETEGIDNHLFKLIRAHGLAREFPLIIATIKAFSEGRIRISDGHVVDGGGKPISGYDLTTEIDQLVKGSPGL